MTFLRKRINDSSVNSVKALYFSIRSSMYSYLFFSIFILINFMVKSKSSIVFIFPIMI